MGPSMMMMSNAGSIYMDLEVPKNLENTCITPRGPSIMVVKEPDGAWKY